MKTLLTSFLLFMVSTFSFAQAQRDIVMLKNGSIIYGIIVEQTPPVQLKIKTADGSIFVYKYDEIEKITREENKVPTATPKTLFKIREPFNSTTFEGEAIRDINWKFLKRTLLSSGDQQIKEDVHRLQLKRVASGTLCYTGIGILAFGGLITVAGEMQSESTAIVGIPVMAGGLALALGGSLINIGNNKILKRLATRYNDVASPKTSLNIGIFPSHDKCTIGLTLNRTF